MPHPQTAAGSAQRTGVQNHSIYEAHFINLVLRVLTDLERLQEERDIDQD